MKKGKDHDKKLNLILRHYRFIMTALGENIFRIALRRFAIALRNTEIIFSQLAVIRKS